MDFPKLFDISDSKMKKKHYPWCINLYDRGLFLGITAKTLQEMNINICYTSVLSTLCMSFIPYSSSSSSSSSPSSTPGFLSVPSTTPVILSLPSHLSSLWFISSRLLLSLSFTNLVILQTRGTFTRICHSFNTKPGDNNNCSKYNLKSFWCFHRWFHVFNVLLLICPFHIRRVETTWPTRRRGLLTSTHTWRNWRMWFGNWNPQLSLVKPQAFDVLISDIVVLLHNDGFSDLSLKERTDSTFTDCKVI